PDLRIGLASRVWDCDENGGACQLVRSTWEGWRQDQRCTTSAGNCFDTNRRLEQKRTVFHDDGDRFRHVTHSMFDGLGNYRRTTKTTNFGQADLLVKTRWTNPEAGLYPPPGTRHGPAAFPVPPTSEPWLLQEASYEQVRDDAGRQLRLDTCYDSSGRRVRERQRGTTLDPHDVIRTATWSGGQVVRESFYGGATQPVGTAADLCSLILPPQPVAQLEHTWVAGARSTSRWSEPDGTPVPSLEVDRDIDVPTGLVSAVRDSSGIETARIYDLLGRLSAERPEPGEGAWLEVRRREPRPDYTGGWAGPQRSFFHYPNGQTTGTPLTRRVEQDDAFGRRFLDLEWAATDDTRYRVYNHDALGQRTRASTYYRPGESYSWHQWKDFDPFGRARLERPADGDGHDVAIEYFGERRALRTESAKRAYDTVQE
ncbi:MAG: hypothetical protein MI919_34145, partial [Holophagales bacterium]|nr:hypothetical protein [Holophagales bacterium]